jgi:hypothetical protein
MNNSIIIAVCLAAFTFGCKDKPHKVNPELIKNDWISKGNNKYFLMIQDSLMIESLTGGEFPISPYAVSNDTLIIYSQDFDYEKSAPFIERVLKLKIEKVDSFELLVRPAYPNFKDTLFFKKMDRAKKNDLKIKILEFSFHSSYGTLSQDLRIDKDSIIYHYGYSRYSKQKGLTKCKLNAKDYEKIQSKVFSINRDSFNLKYPGPVSTSYYLYIKTPNDSINISGYLDNSSDKDLIYLFYYLMSLEYSIDLENAGEDKIVFRN